jgi:cold-inducible RNA-binding protein
MVSVRASIPRWTLETRRSGTVEETSRLFFNSKTMNTKMYVGNLSFDTTESDLRAACEVHGAVTDVSLPMDRSTGRSRGFAFVTMQTQEGMTAAISKLNGKPLLGRLLTVNEARPREERPAFSGSGGRRDNRF